MQANRLGLRGFKACKAGTLRYFALKLALIGRISEATAVGRTVRSEIWPCYGVRDFCRLALHLIAVQQLFKPFHRQPMDHGK
jgi:hypothetical protein